MMQKDGDYFLDENYGDQIQKKFSEHNPMCVLRMNKTRIIGPNHPKHGSLNFLSIYAFCNNKNCKIYYTFTLECVPGKKDENVELLVR